MHDKTSSEKCLSFQDNDVEEIACSSFDSLSLSNGFNPLMTLNLTHKFASKTGAEDLNILAEP